MSYVFYLSACIAVLASLMTVLVKNPIHALLHFILSLVALAVAIYILRAPFAAALEVIVYAGAIMVLFVFVVMLLNVSAGEYAPGHFTKHLLSNSVAIVFAALLFGEVVYVVSQVSLAVPNMAVLTGAKEVAVALFQRYGILVEAISLLLLAALVGAYHLGFKREEKRL